VPAPSPAGLDQQRGDERRRRGVVGQRSVGGGHFALRSPAGDAETDGELAFGGEEDARARVLDRFGPGLFELYDIEAGDGRFAEQLRVGALPGIALDAGDLGGVGHDCGADFGGGHGRQFIVVAGNCRWRMAPFRR